MISFEKKEEPAAPLAKPDNKIKSDNPFGKPAEPTPEPVKRPKKVGKVGFA